MTQDPTLPRFVRFGREICGDLAQAERREWWLANGLGGYAAGTIAGTLTRRYHGLLVAPVNPPLGRVLVAAKADASVVAGGCEWPLSTNRWASGHIEPQGHQHIESFHLEGRMPVWRYALGDLAVEMRIWMEPGANTTYVAFRREGGQGEAQLRVALLVNARDHHGQTERGAFAPDIGLHGGRLEIAHHNWFRMNIQARGGVIEADRTWYENFDLPIERERGLPDRDNHLCVGHARLELRPGEWVGLALSLHDDASPYLEEAMRRFRAAELQILRRARVQQPALIGAPEWIDQLLLATDSFVFARPLPGAPDGESVIAGYPWFGDWGRDTMIALPGLTLASGRYDSARRILGTFARFVDRGMLPNVFPGAGQTPEYNTVDAALWYVEAWRAYVDVTGDLDSLRAAFASLEGIVQAHRSGTRYGIGVDPADGLLRAGEPGVQLTWMDARIGDWVVTPRIGKPVEINALWFNALAAMAEFCRRLGRSAASYEALADQVQAGFARFVRADGRGLRDVIDGPGGDDETIRPNQILAVSLAHSPLDRAQQAAVLEICGRELLVSHGLRSLPPSHPEYAGRYEGGVWERDGSYHQGPVWAWLLGHYAWAEYRVHGDAAAAQRRLEPLRDHLLDAGLGTVSEILDGDPPHTPRGAPSQAWSVACALDAWWQLERARQICELQHPGLPHQAAA